MSGAPILPVVITGSKIVPQRRSAASEGSRLVIRVGPAIRSSRRRGREARQDIVRLTLDSISTMMQEVEAPPSRSRPPAGAAQTAAVHWNEHDGERAKASSAIRRDWDDAIHPA